MQERLNVVRLSEDEKSVVILDQTKLPNHEEYLDLEDAESMWNAIKLLQVRGAPAIGVFAGYALAVLAGQIADLPRKEFLEMLQKQADYLNSSRPTAVNLSWALKRQMEKAEKCKENDCHEIARTLIQEAKRIDAENLEMNRKIAEYGVTLIKDGDGILTHCNAGYLACLGYGTATAPMYMAQEKGMHIHVYSDETRPLLQGARLTSFELAKSGVPVTSICDNMASLVMKEARFRPSWSAVTALLPTATLPTRSAHPVLPFWQSITTSRSIPSALPAQLTSAQRPAVTFISSREIRMKSVPCGTKSQ